MLYVTPKELLWSALNYDILTLFQFCSTNAAIWINQTAINRITIYWVCAYVFPINLFLCSYIFHRSIPSNDTTIWLHVYHIYALPYQCKLSLCNNNFKGGGQLILSVSSLFALPSHWCKLNQTIPSAFKQQTNDLMLYLLAIMLSPIYFLLFG